MRKTLSLLLTLLAVTIAAWAGDPWKQKAFKDWDDNDLRQILYESPWTKQVDIAVKDASRVAVIGGLSGHVGGPMTAGTTADAKLTFYVRWGSAMTPRRALILVATRHGQMSEEEGVKSLEAPIENYKIVVLGPGLSALHLVTLDCQYAISRITIGPVP